MIELLIEIIKDCQEFLRLISLAELFEIADVAEENSDIFMLFSYIPRAVFHLVPYKWRKEEAEDLLRL